MENSIIKNHFSNGHKILKHKKYDDCEIVEFGRENSFVGWMRFVLNGNFLSVHGDYGDAIYRWHGHNKLSFKWLSELGHDYFSSK